MKIINKLLIISVILLTTACQISNASDVIESLVAENSIKSEKAALPSSDIILSRAQYHEKLYGFWLGQSIANWTGLVTEMDKIGGAGPHGVFYTREDWGKKDQPSIWGQGVPSQLSKNIDFVFKDEDEIWGSDDDTDIEYIYQHLLFTHKTSILSAKQIRDGWIKHIYSEEQSPFGLADDGKQENFLWVSNQRAHELMLKDGLLPPATSHPDNNKEYDMIDAQLSTEIFGFFAPTRPDIALKMAHLPIRTTARANAAWAAEFYVIMYSLASLADDSWPIKAQIQWMANTARQRLPHHSYSAKMFDLVKARYHSGVKWERVRDELYQKYQVNQEDGYDITSKQLYCNGCFASGINFAASIISLLYGEGNIVETIKIAALAGWDSDNPAATWGGLLGFMIGKNGVEAAFNRKFSKQFNIHRTRGNFPNQGIDNFAQMAERGLAIIDRVVVDEMEGSIDLNNDAWHIPKIKVVLAPGN